jgi:hypothetical protein
MDLTIDDNFLSGYTFSQQSSFKSPVAIFLLAPSPYAIRRDHDIADA